MKNSLFTRIFIGYLFIILVFSGVSLLAFSDTFKDLYRRSLMENLTSLGLSLKAEVTESLEGGTYLRLNERLKGMARQVRTRITVIDAKGAVVADSNENPRTMENHGNRPEVMEALSGRTGSSTRYSSTMNQDALYVALPLERDGRIVGVLRTSLFVKDTRIPPLLMGHLIEMWALFSLLALIAALIVSGSISRPIRELTGAARKLASGDFNTRVFLNRNDEFRALADTFNSMSRELETAFDELKRQKAELKSIIDSLREGLVVIGRRGNIIYCNESLKAILGRETALEGQLYWEALRQSQFVELMEKARSGMLNPVQEVEIEGKIFLCSATHIDPDDEVVLVLHDITDMREVEKIKRDLVSSVSHELRTPLTSIKGFAETLEEEADERTRHYVEIIKRNADRLINIVSDLLLLSQLEERGAGLEVEELDLGTLAENTIRIFDNQVREKNLTLRLERPADLPKVQADPFKIEQMLINLLDNAIKYTDSGEILLALSGGREVTIEVRDTGIGMPRDKLSHIFERFYVIDKSRSRKTGGTGLGLSIVKHIVLLHGGEISVESTPGAGSRFCITLPLHS
ncbi:MAG: ATP-binding protein [Syntrophorhabdales bacterium]|jgi:two-component system phosphate regulon sensor histidine kinase PhoR